MKSVPSSTTGNPSAFQTASGSESGTQTSPELWVIYLDQIEEWFSYMESSGTRPEKLVKFSV